MAQATAGDIVINLRANLVDFKAGMEEGSQAASRATKKLSSDIQSQMTEARGGLMLVEESVGIRLPRELNRLIAQIPGVGALFANMLPIIGVVAAAGIIVTLIEKHQELALAIQKTKQDQDNLTIGEEDYAKQLEVTNLKIADQIAKLQGVPEKNRLAETLLETSIASDTMATRFATAFEKIDEDLGKTTTILGTFKAELDALSKGSFVELTGIAPLQDQVKNINASLLQMDEARLRLGKADSSIPAQVTAIQDVQKAWQKVGVETLTALDIAKNTNQSVAVIDQLTRGLTDADSAAKALGEQVKNIKLSYQAADISGVKAADDIIIKQNEQLIASNTAVVQSKAALDLQRVANTANTATKEIDLQIASDAKSLTLTADLYTRKQEIANNQVADDIAILNDRYTAEVNAANDLFNEKKSEAEKLAGLSGLTTEQEKAFKLQEATDQQIHDSALLKMAQDHQKEVEGVEQQGRDASNTIEIQKTNDLAAQLKARSELARRSALEQNSFHQQMIALDISMEKSKNDFEHNLGVTNDAQYLAAQRVTAAQELALEKEKLDTAFALVKTDDPNYPLIKQKYLDDTLIVEQKFYDQEAILNQKALEDRKKVFDVGFDQFNQGVHTMIGDAITGNQSLLADVKQTAQQMLTEWVNYFIQLKLRALETWLFMKALSLIGSIGNPGTAANNQAGGTGDIPGDFGGTTPTFAAAGASSVSIGSPYIIGEAGPELFVPSSGGSIIPSDQLKSMGGSATIINQTINIKTDNPDQFHASADQIQRTAFNSAFRAAKRA